MHIAEYMSGMLMKLIRWKLYCSRRYVDERIKNSKNIRKELNLVVNDFLSDYPEATKPLYS